MIFQLTPDDMIKVIESVPLENVPEAFSEALISEDKLKEWAREILDGGK